MKKKILALASIVFVVVLKIYFSYAISLDRVTLVKFRDPVKFLSYNNKEVGYSMVGHILNGVQYPAYCIEPEKPGVYETDSYQVTISGNVNDRNIIKIIQNGYPYKTPSQIGVNNEQEAYYATKTALWCYVNSRNINDYKALSSKYDYILDAMKRIYTNGLSDASTIDLEFLKVNKENELVVDTLDNRYFSQTFAIESNYNISNYNVNIVGDNIPEGTIISDENNNSKSNFEKNEKFKILIPIDNIKEERGNIEIIVNANLKTQKVLFGDAPSNLQDHAITIMADEESIAKTNVEYEKIYGKIRIIKTSTGYNKYTDKEAGANLEGAEFAIINKNNEVIDTIITNAEGVAESKDLERGEYYIKEITSPEYYLKNELQYTAIIQYKNEVVEIKISDENIELDVDINKHGPIEAKTNEIINYSFSNITNMSNVYLDEFCFIEIIPTEAIRATKFNTGTWNQELKYSFRYKTNLSKNEVEYSNNLTTLENHCIDLSNLRLKEDEYITQIILHFEQVKPGFKEIEMPTMEAKVKDGLPNGYNFENIAKIIGKYLEKEIEKDDKIKTVIYTPIINHEPILPKTGSNL